MRIVLASLATVAAIAITSPADAAWRRFETEHFIIYSQSPDNKAEELARGLEGIDGLMRMATGLSAERPPVKVRIYEMADKGEVQAALGQRDSGVAGFYTSNVLGPYAVTLRRLISARAISRRASSFTTNMRITSCCNISPRPIPVGMSRDLPN